MEIPQKQIQNTLKNWYQIHKRDLPWRATKDPYKIWISEIILQQTRVNQGYDYYIRFIERFPNVTTLANADEDEVLKYWQGLGYYSRARNLHKAAKQIVSDFGSNFPKKHEDVLKLSGVGEYTAAAICSLAYKQPYAVVDGNVFRVISRLTGTDTPIDTTTGKKVFANLAQNLLDKQNSDIHNQAVMEFGALQCTPASPDCEICPLKNHCAAYKLNLVSQLPVKQGRTAVSHRFFNYFLIRKNEFTFLQKRNRKDIWQNLYEFPLIETTREVDFSELIEMNEFKTLFDDVANISVLKTSNPVKHILSHRIINAKFYTVQINRESEEMKSLLKTPIAELDKYAISRLTELFLEKELVNL